MAAKAYQGIQELKAAETNAARIVAEARTERQRRLASAKEEARGELEEMKQQQLEEYERLKRERLGDGSQEAAVAETTKQEIEALGQQYGSNKESVVEFLLGLVTDVRTELTHAQKHRG